MPCSKYEGKQKRLCFMTHGWKDMSKVKMFQKERKEHPTLSVKAIKTIVKNHMRIK